MAMQALNTTWFSLLQQNPNKLFSLCRVSNFIRREFSKFAGDSNSDNSPVESTGRRSKISGGVKRDRVQSSILSGLVSVNGRVTDKVSHKVKGGDKVNGTIADLKPQSSKYQQSNNLVLKLSTKTG
ncbi:hypothetical protein P3L10_011930 [Capsicum annuum]